MAEKLPMSIVLRMSDVRLSEQELGFRLKTEFDRFEPNKKLPHSYAQISIESGSVASWGVIHEAISRVGPEIVRLKRNGDMGSVSLDIAWAMASTSPMMSRTIPATVAEIVGRYGIDIEVTVYVSSDADRRLG